MDSLQRVGTYGEFAVFVILLVPCDASGEFSGIQQIGANVTMDRPLFATHAPGDSNRLFIAEQGGAIRIIDLYSTDMLSTPFLTIDVDDELEGGLLGMAFHPNYSAPPGTTGRGLFYVYATIDNDLPETTSPFTSHILEYAVTGDPATSNMANPTPVRGILQFNQPQTNHNGGWIGFNPQVTAGQAQYLYIMSGDGGNSADSGPGHTEGTGNGQDVTNNFFGKILRIDVNSDAFTGTSDPDNTKNYAIPVGNPFDGTNGDQEIWAYGLRNPYRASFDRQNGDLWIGDVGEHVREEIDYQPASKTTASYYGLRLWEGNLPFGAMAGDSFPDNYVAPVYDYDRGDLSLQGETVIGGYRYRGPDPDLQGLYIFGDANQPRVWQMTPPEPVVPNTAVAIINNELDNLVGVNNIVSFGEDANGNLYFTDLSGRVFRILTDNLLRGDFDADGDVDGADYTTWRTGIAMANPNPPSDGNGNAVFDTADYVAWRNNLGASSQAWAGLGAAVPELASAAYLFQATALLAIASLLVYRRK